MTSKKYFERIAIGRNPCTWLLNELGSNSSSPCPLFESVYLTESINRGLILSFCLFCAYLSRNITSYTCIEVIGFFPQTLLKLLDYFRQYTSFLAGYTNDTLPINIHLPALFQKIFSQIFFSILSLSLRKKI